MKPRKRARKAEKSRAVEGPHVSKGSRLLRAEWKASGLSMTNFSKRIGVHRTSVFRWIAGTIRPDRDNIFNMEKVLGIPVRAWEE